MGRGVKILITVLVVVAALLAVNTIVINSQTKPAEVTVPGGRIMQLSSVDLQVVDKPATGPGPEGAPIVLLHCYGCSLSWWDDITPLLNRTHRIIRFDLTGFGGSEKPGSGYSMTDQARAVAEALNRLGVEGAVVVGHSMGGLVATALAQNSSELVDREVVISTPNDVASDASLPFVAKLGYVPVLGQATWRLAPDSVIENQYADAFAPGFDYKDAFPNPNELVSDHDAMTYRSYRDSEQESKDFTDEGTVASRVTASAVPFMAILGSEDQIVDTDAVQSAYEAVPGAEVHVLPDVGHSAEVEAPRETARLIENFAKGAELVKPTPPSAGGGGGKKKPQGGSQGSQGGHAKKPGGAGGGAQKGGGGQGSGQGSAGGGKQGGK